jgi:hypothetical protein
LKWYQVNPTTSFSVGTNPSGVAFDGESMWTANNGDGTVSKVRVTDGEILGTFKVGGGPIGLVFDGANIWVTNDAGNTMSKLRASDG